MASMDKGETHGSGAPGSSSEGESFQIIVTTLKGKAITIDTKDDDTIEEVKEKITDKEGVPKEAFGLVYGPKPLEEGKTLKEYGIKGMDTVRMTAGLKGGMFQVPPDGINDPERLKAVLDDWAQKMNFLNGENEKLKKDLEKKDGTKGIRKVIQSGNKD